MKPRKIITLNEENSGIMKSCCCCLDIRTGTIVLGMFHLMLHLAGLVVLTQMLLHPEFYGGYYDGYGVPKTSDTSLALLITCCSFIITAMLIYGTIKRKPSYLLPFFCLQVFDFVINMLGAVGIFYVPEFKDMIVKNNHHILHNKHLEEMETKNLLMMAVTLSVIILSIKAYLIACVWSCYKTLIHQLQQQVVASITHELNQDTDCENAMLLPRYEEVVKDTPTESPPPYTAEN